MWMRAFMLFAALVASGRALAADLSQILSADERLQLFARAVVKAGVVPTLREPGPYIVFAPSDRALANEGSAFLLDIVLLADSNAGRLVDLVGHHIARPHGPALLAGDATLQTLAREPLAVARVGTGLVVAGYAVATDRIVAENGVVYIVDRLLWPRDRAWEAGLDR